MVPTASGFSPGLDEASSYRQTIQSAAFFCDVGTATFIVCGVTAFYSHRSAHGRTAEERAAYAIGESVGEQAPRDSKLPTAAELNMMAQKYFKQQGTGNQLRNPSRAGELQNWDVGLKMVTAMTKKTHSR